MRLLISIAFLPGEVIPLLSLALFSGFLYSASLECAFLDYEVVLAMKKNQI